MAEPRATRRGHAWAFAAWLALAAVLFAPFWLHGEVIAPDRGTGALGLDSEPLPGRIENRQFADYSAVFVPEVAVHLHGPRAGWLATWDPYNEIGRPLYHDAGMSPAYLPTWIGARLTGDPRRLYTWHSLLTLLAGGTFAFLFVRGRGLHPLAAFTAAAFLGLTPIILYWLGFPMFHSVLAWACGALYGVDRLARGRDGVGWAVLCFSIYSLLMTAYQQDVIGHAYLLAAFGATTLWTAWRRGGAGAAARVGVACASAVAVGLLCAAPAYLDLLVQAGESARTALDADFFLANLPVVGTPDAARRYAAAFFLQELWGNPVAQGFRHGTDGMSLQPLFLGLLVVGAIARTRATWAWCIAIAIGLVATFDHAVYRFAVEHLGFHLSYSLPVYDAMIPMMVVIAHGVDALGNDDAAAPPARRRLMLAVATAGAAIAAVAWLAADLALRDGAAVRWTYLVVAVAAIPALVSPVLLPAGARRWGGLALGGIVAATVLLHGRPLLLTQAPRDIAATSPLVEALRRHLPAGGRYAIVGDSRLLVPNRNATLALPTVHTYNSLSSRRYQALVQRLGGTTRIHGRHNQAIGARPDPVAFALSGIAVVLSKAPLDSPGLEAVDRVAGMRLYRVRDFQACCLRVPAPRGEARVESLDSADWSSVRLLADRGDELELAATPAAAPGLLVLGRAWHPHWRAAARVAGRMQPLETVAVDAAFLGVRLPAQATDVRVYFAPNVRFAWLGHAFFLLLFAALAGRGLLRHRRPPFPGTPAR